MEDEKKVILDILKEKDMSGYEVVETLCKSSDNEFEDKVGTIYPILHYLVKRRYLKTYYIEAGGKTRKVYRLTKLKGRKEVQENEKR